MVWDSGWMVTEEEEMREVAAVHQAGVIIQR